jgi:hypothetical protein
MASKNIQKIAEHLQATVGEPIPNANGGAFGAAHLAAVLSARLKPAQGKRMGRPSDPAWNVSRRIPMKEETLAQLQALATQFSNEGRAISPMQVAAQLLEKSLEQVMKEGSQTHV